jgi:hypothetical protein
VQHGRCSLHRTTFDCTIHSPQRPAFHAPFTRAIASINRVCRACGSAHCRASTACRSCRDAAAVEWRGPTITSMIFTSGTSPTKHSRVCAGTLGEGFGAGGLPSSVAMRRATCERSSCVASECRSVLHQTRSSQSGATTARSRWLTCRCRCSSLSPRYESDPKAKPSHGGARQSVQCSGVPQVRAIVQHEPRFWQR